MKKDVILAGVGGQGILSIAAVIGLAAMDRGLFVKQAEVHGMSQRGGAVQSHLRLSSQPIASDLIPGGTCDLILSVEPMESLRYLPFLHQQGWLITSDKPFVNIPDYPGEEALFNEIRKVKNHLVVAAQNLARDLGSQKVSNMVMLGAASEQLELGLDELSAAIESLFMRKGMDIVQMNIRALEAGKMAAGSR
jgi:indolepyruvate ferredoxin oxidoreductase beta subunit